MRILESISRNKNFAYRRSDTNFGLYYTNVYVTVVQGHEVAFIFMSFLIYIFFFFSVEISVRKRIISVFSINNCIILILFMFLILTYIIYIRQNWVCSKIETMVFEHYV